MKQAQLLFLARQIIDRLEEYGYEAYFVGGFVRDRLLNKPIKDIDIATSAMPDAVLKLFKRAEPTGLQHGTVTVILEGTPFEVTTFRSESGYTDHRRPDQVAFITDLREDLSRRDFTINAMALDRSMQLIDPFGGELDLLAKLLRCVGDARERFDEDALRMLRCIRFAAEYCLEIEQATWDAILLHQQAIRNVATERVRVELERIIEGSSPERGVALLVQSGLSAYFQVPLMMTLPNVKQPDQHMLLTNWQKTDDPILRWAIFFFGAGTGAKEAQTTMRKLTFPNRKSEKITSLLLLNEALRQVTTSDHAELRKQWILLALQFGKETSSRWLSWLQLMEVSGNEAVRWQMVSKTLAAQGKQWLDAMPVHEAAELAINGKQLLASGIPPGPAMGDILSRLLRETALGAIPNEPHLLQTEAIRLWQSLDGKR